MAEGRCGGPGNQVPRLGIESMEGLGSWCFFRSLVVLVRWFVGFCWLVVFFFVFWWLAGWVCWEMQAWPITTRGAGIEINDGVSR